MKVAVLGLGEAGTLYSAGFLAHGWQVTGFDPGDTATPAGVERFDDVASAVRDADLVLSLTSASVALQAATDAVPHLAAHSTYADMNAAPAQIKTETAAVIAAAGVDFADVAVVGSVPANGAATALVISGPGSTAAAAYFGQLGASVEDIAGLPGDASNRKLLRSAFMKGLGALIVESEEAARAAGAQQWVRAQMAGELAGGFASVDRLHDGTVKHAARRSVEMAASVTLLDSIGVRPVLAAATTEVHRALADAGDRGLDDHFPET